MRSLLIILLVIISINAFSQNGAEYFPNKIILKVKLTHKDKCFGDKISIPTIKVLLNKHNATSQEKVFPKHSSNLSKSRAGSKLDLSTIYKINFPENSNLEEVIFQLKKDKNVAYAELIPVNELIYTPSDTQNYRQWYLDAIKAYDAWEIDKGDSAITIAIVDTGTEILHEDLKDNLFLNLNDTINGIDDDNDGYIDNYYGWDIGMNDNDVNPENHAGASHGSNCAGIASATTDNILGISGVGFNSRLMTVKIDNAAGQLVGAYQGVVYAADHGADIMNLSWGSYNYSEFGKDIIDYAYDKGVLIFAGAGNGPFTGPSAGIGTEDKFYPAAYNNAIAIGATFENDTIKESSNFGYWLGIFAPGEKMWTTFRGNSYGRNGGTSMASPVVAGCAAIVKSHFPTYNNQQIIQKLYNSGDFIEQVNVAKYQNKLGAGRVNLFRALTENNLPGIEFKDIEITDNNDDSFINGDTLSLKGNFKNWLADASNVDVKMEVMDKNLPIINGDINLGTISSLDSASLNNNPFQLVISNITSLNEEIDIKFTITADSNYSRIQYLIVNVNKEILTVKNQNITISLSSSGSIGYSASNNLGEGIKYKTNVSQLYEGSFMLGNSENYIANQFRDNPNPDLDFKTEELVTFVNTDIPARKTLGVFNDKNLSISPKVEIRQANYFFNDPTVSDAIVFSYDIKNISSSTLNNLYAGIIMDWDLMDYAKNKILNDSQRKMGVCYSSDSTLFAGIRALNHLDKTKHYAIDNTATGEGGVNLSDGFTDAEKFTVISTNRLIAGTGSPTGNDVIDVVSIGPFDIEADSMYNVSFAVILSDSINDLFTTSDSVSMLFEDYAINVAEIVNAQKSLFEIFPNPTKDYLNVKFNTKTNESFLLDILDINGRVIRSKEYSSNRNSSIIKLNLSDIKTGVYLIRINGNSIQFEDKFVVLAN